MTRRINMVGNTYGRLAVLEETKTRAFAACDCGAEKWYRRGNLLAGYTQSCGCLRNENIKAVCQTHGHKPGTGASRTYSSWSNMRKRCDKENADNYKYYGGRGIKYCERWNLFENFLTDMGKCPEGLELDRIDNNGNYELANCRWVTHSVNVRNRG